MIGRIQRVRLREVWRHEALDFTTWLEENVDVLVEATGLQLSGVEREQAVGAFSVDLIAEDEDGRPVVIENQLEKSNHDHLGGATELAGCSDNIVRHSPVPVSETGFSAALAP